MPWYLPWSDHVAKRVCKYLLQRFLGQFLEEKLSLDQLDVNLFKGTGSISNVALDVQALNELAEQQNLPFQFTDGLIDEISISIPWSSLLVDSLSIQVTGLLLTAKYRARDKSKASMFESMWSSMSSSMQLAEECMRNEQNNIGDKNIHNFEGIERFAQTIDLILSKVKLTFISSSIRLEQLNYDNYTGIALIMTTEKMEYFDEAVEKLEKESSPPEEYLVPAYSTKKILMEGVAFFTEEFTFTKGSDDGLCEYYEYAEKSMDSQTVLVGRLAGRQEIRIKFNQDGIVGPKVEFGVNLGALTIFLTPRQIHKMIYLLKGVTTYDDQSKGRMRSRCVQKPLDSSDLQRIENELLNAMQPGLSGHGWSNSIDESDEEFTSLRSRRRSASSLPSSTASSMCSSSSFGSSSRYNDTHKKPLSLSGTVVDMEPLPLVFTFELRISCLSAVVLHEDIATVSQPSGVASTASSRELNLLAEQFFTSLGHFTVSGFGNKDFQEAKELFLKACHRNHLRFIAAPFIIHGSESTTSHGSIFKGVITACSAEISECLLSNNDPFNMQYFELLSFTNSPTKQTIFDVDPCFRFNFKINNTDNGYKIRKRSAVHKSEYSVTLQPFRVEIDLSLIDRLSPLLNLDLSSWKKENNKESQHVDFEEFLIRSIDHLLPKQDCKLQTSSALLRIRFPIPDLRPVHDMNRSPWWSRNVRGDYLIFDLTDLILNTTIDAQDPISKIEFQARNIVIKFQEEDFDSPITIAEASSDMKSNAFNDGDGDLNWPRIVVTVYPASAVAKNLDLNVSTIPLHAMHLSILSTLENTKKREPSPFSAKTVVYGVKECEGVDLTDEHADGEELITPANKQEMTEFIDLASSNTKIKVDLSFPTASILLPSKHLYEIIYNRITTDLMLWAPSAPNKVTTESTPADAWFYPTYNLSKSIYDSDSDDNSTYDSLSLDPESSHKSIRKKIDNIPARKGQSKIVVNLSVCQGIVDLYLPVRDAQGNFIPGKSGEILLTFDNGNLFYVSGFGGKKDCDLMCVQVNHFSLNHCALLSDLWNVPKLRKVGDSMPHYLNHTLYKVEVDASLDSSTDVGTGHFQSLDMLSLALKLDKDEKARRLKIFKVAVGLRNTQLRHRVCSSANTWYNQTVDFFDVDDYPIMGYEPSTVLTEINLHLWNCNLDYRPLYLPLRCIINLGGFNISSNIASKTNTSTLRLVSEDATLFISDVLGAKPQYTGVNLHRDFVCVVELGLFELSMRLNDFGNGIRPKTDLRASANCLHIRTCADSAKALSELLMYFANDGDLTFQLEDHPHQDSGNDVEKDSLIRTAEEDDLIQPTMTQSEKDLVNDLMADAMTDIDHVEGLKVKSLTNKPPTTAYFTCTEEELHLSDTLGSDLTVENNLFDSDEWEKEFFIIDKEAGVGLLPKKGIPEVRMLTEQSIRLVENHFTLPSGKTDLLKSPKNYPRPMHRYTLTEFNLIWQMYGGSDLSKDSESSKATPVQKRRVNIQQPSPSKSGSKSHSCDSPVTFSKTNMESVFLSTNQNAINDSNTLAWKDKGGRARCYEVLMELQLTKVRFQLEMYPDNTKEASRQVLLIKDVELRDRLASSQINKFLYQYFSEAVPKQSQANMVTIKSVQVRTDPKLTAQECCLRISVLPLRLNIDQDSLFFLYRFFAEIGGHLNDGEKDEDDSSTNKCQTPSHTTPKPVMLITSNEKPSSEPDPLLIQLEEQPALREKTRRQSSKPSHHRKPPSPPVYFRSFIFSPEVLVKIDYQGKHVDMSHGPLAGIIIGLAQLNNSEFRLKRIVHRYGLLGVEKLINFVLTEWTNDIKRNQLPGLLGGVGPIYSFIQLFQGIRDLFWLPIEQYQKDGRLVRGFQRGASSFTTSSAMAVLELTSRLIQIIQATAETAYDMVSPGPSVRVRRRRNNQSKSRKNFVQPVDIREGVANAISLVRDGLGETAQNIVQVATEEHEQKGVTGAVGGVLRQIPPTVVKPIILASEATNNVIGGMRSQLVPDARREAVQKWRRHDI